MALLQLVDESHPHLRQPTQPVSDFGDSLQTIVDDMLETMYEVNGAGLAATQVGLDIRVAVIDVSSDRSQPLVLVNPEIIDSGSEQNMEMGCLSLPGCWAAVKRAGWVKVRAQDRNGEFFEMEGEGILAEAFQHEIDHLDGILFIDKLSPLKQKMVRQRAKKALKKQQRRG
ncbi:peptide deformylase [Endozoicomonas gorgoniicola]|uniref:Peptide deformylase n=1 Tax=Endozoicomonas gorgoniicola TaxID=1234144 RepID=A0ABT3MX00_9GAMM|nr:peptide deformylase [Endozoicomonas gorgoniicola]MCW7553910.1 peptide deformylase [Endozoicomonas gorgoniicola]